ncbi:MAG: hypothetical protein E3J87_04215 [Candidatus Cloacimonadota bacterium]|nr:MAG: hypothetical protein E3J87_04215 [Candidatus Cloacimonadota bacterium]
MLKQSTKLIFFVIVTLLLTIPLFAQAPDTLWTKTFGGVDDDQGWSVRETSDGCFIILGWTKSFGAGNLDIYLLKVDQNGNYLWHKTFGGSEYEEGRSILETADGGFIIAGLTGSYGVGNKDVYLIKTDSLGNAEWTRTYGGTADDKGYDVQITTDGGYIITGYTYSFGSGSADVYLIKTNANGNITWANAFGLSGPDRGWSVKETSDGGYIVAGNTESFGGDLDVYIVKTNSSGDSVWARVYGGTGSDRAHWIEETYDGRYVIVGYNGSVGGVLTEVWLLKTYANGDTMWTKMFGGLDWEAGYTVRETADRGYIIGGYTYSIGAGAADVYLVRTDSLGNTLWSKAVGGADHDRGFDISFTSDGGYIATGFARSFGAGDKDLYLVKTKPDPAFIEMEKNPKKNFKFSLIGKNPFNDKISVKYVLPEKSIVRLSIYNLVGQEINILVDRIEKEGSHSIVWDGRNSSGEKAAGGIYFLRFQAGEYNTVEKLLIIR